MQVTIDERKYDMDYALKVKESLSQKDVGFLKSITAARAMNMMHIHLLMEYGEALCIDLRDEVHQLLSPIHDLSMFRSKTQTWRERSFGCFYVSGSTLETQGVLMKRDTPFGVQHYLSSFPNCIQFIRSEYRELDRFVELVYKFDPTNKEEVIMPEVDVMSKVEEALAAIEKVKEQKKNISELVFKVTEQEAIIKRLEAALDDNRKKLVKTQEDAAALEAEVEKYKPAYDLLKNIKELEI